MKKSEGLERLSLALMGMAIGILFGGLAMQYLPILIVGSAPIIVILTSFLVREISEREKKKEKENFYRGPGQT